MLIVPLSLISSNVLNPADEPVSFDESVVPASEVAAELSLEPHAVNVAAVSAVISNPLVNLFNNLFLILIILFHLYFYQFFNCPRKIHMASIVHMLLIQF